MATRLFATAAVTITRLLRQCRAVQLVGTAAAVIWLTHAYSMGQESEHAHATRVPHLYGYDENDFKRHVQEVTRSESEDTYDYDVYRSHDGKRLDCYRWPQHGREILSVTHRGQFKVLMRPANNAFLDEQQHFVAWYNRLEDGIQFKNGYVQHVPMFCRFGFDPSRRYFYMAEPDAFSVVVAVLTPARVVARVPLEINRIFLKDDKLFVFGDDPYYAAKKINREIPGLIYGIRGSALELQREVHIQRR